MPSQLDLEFQSLVNPTEGTGLPSSKFKEPKKDDGSNPGNPGNPGGPGDPDWWNQFGSGEDRFGGLSANLNAARAMTTLSPRSGRPPRP
jgi:hypothetical protein